MNRSGYIVQDNFWDYVRWRGAVASALRGRRGQAFLREMLAALDAIPEKVLVAEAFVTADGHCCAMGAVAKARGIDGSTIDPEDTETVAKTLGLAEAMVRELAYLNDGDNILWVRRSETPEERWVRMRAWVVSAINAE